MHSFLGGGDRARPVPGNSERGVAVGAHAEQDQIEARRFAELPTPGGSLLGNGLADEK